MPNTEYQVDDLVAKLNSLDAEGLDRLLYGLDALDQRPRPDGIPETVAITDRIAVLIGAYRQAKSAVSAAATAAPDSMSAGILTHMAVGRRNRIATELVEALVTVVEES